jgi:CRP-like cAMP-binding protein
MTECPFSKKIFLFQDLQGPEVEEVLLGARERDFTAGSIIIREGEEGDSMFIMCQGEVEITKRLTLELEEDTPKERVMIRLIADDGVSFGEMALLEDEARSATVTALTRCRLLELKREAFLRLVREHPRMGVKLLIRLAQLLSRHLRKTNQDVVKLTTALAIALGG